MLLSRNCLTPSRPCGAVVPALRNQQVHPPPRHRCIARNLGDDLMDYVTAGPKMRKWYGQGERLPRDGGDQEPGRDDEPEEEEVEQGGGDGVLVMEADSATGEQVVLQLILARAAVKVLVKDVTGAKTSYGPYVDPVSFDVNNAEVMKKALKGVGSVVCLGRMGQLPKVARAAGVAHIVLLSAHGTGGGSGGFLGGLFDGEMSQLRDPSREEAVAQSGVPYSIVRVASVKDTPGGQARLALTQLPGNQASQPVSREDLAMAVVATLQRLPGTGRTFQVMSQGAGQPPEDWTPLFATLQEAGAPAPA